MAGGFEYIEKAYGVAFKRGQKVTVNGRLGKITSASNGYLRVRFFEAKHSSPCHPTWRVEVIA